ncbi:cyclophilin type peptidyl-prolyl cis-trans isomerase [Glycocaulis alkaliphilus]|uniref:peptidylprolyl isomerase n=1 Tax=Glycocaulis alkaliphilus TaxID=1434191 RepID=A0A3T0EAC0_9PROT|nr:peptidylprolyl isomerase [Glycocaulis alkaliphilus]AZU03998.1 cyclophilin type peptidyl-prolyl cis-trans isomerase [Glycocaulis alkaliphilus]GGB74957.1 peptidyl-prolyl cis-trans isomerase [Glycocaulis alkaliphilus]
MIRMTSALLTASVSAFALAATACADASTDTGMAESSATIQEADGSRYARDGIPSGPDAARQIIADAPEAAWRAVDPDRLLVISTRHGDIWVELAPEFAPNHVARIRELVAEGFYDGKVWHRVIRDFMAQGGGASDNPGLNADREPLQAEFMIARRLDTDIAISELQDRVVNPREANTRARAGFWNGFPASTMPLGQAGIRADGQVESWLLHCRGAVAAARTSNPDSANSQFYITTGTPAHLEAVYTVWGRVRAGQDAVDAIRVGTMGETMGFRPDFIMSMRMASELPESDRLTIEVFDTDTPDFAVYLQALQAANNDRLPDVCDIEIPVRITE